MQKSVSFYDYSPSLAAAVVFAVLYSITFLLTTALWLKHRAWVCVVMVVAAASMHIASCLPAVTSY